MVNPWIEHVKKYAKDHNLSYRNALSEAKTSYKTKMTGGQRDPSSIVRAIYGNNRKKFDVNKVHNPSKHLTNMFNKKVKKPILNLRISQCKTILTHSHSRGFKKAKTTYAPSNFYDVSVVGDAYKENFGYEMGGYHNSTVVFEGIPTDKQIEDFIIGRHLFSSAHIDGEGFTYSADNQCGRKTDRNKIFKGKWNGKGEDPTKTHKIDLQKYDSKPKVGEEDIVLKKLRRNEPQPQKPKTEKEQYEDNIKRVMVTRKLTRKEAIEHIAIEEARFKEEQKRTREEEARMVALQSTFKNVRRR